MTMQTNESAASGTAAVPMVEAGQLHRMLRDGQEIALFDVREAGQFGQAHLFFAVPLPFSRLEIEAPRLAPRRGVRIVLVDEDESVARRAALRLGQMGYTQVQVLRGGNRGWTDAGHVLFAGIHVPSKTFGEMVEHHYGTPHLSARELDTLRRSGEDVVVLDGRPFGEYQKMAIPGAICCPNGELGLWVRDLVRDDDTRIVINCAGRTRSIIGAQTLRNLGLKNPVFALQNGTMGWVLDGLHLAHASARRHPSGHPPRHLEPARQAAQALAQAHGVAAIDASTLRAWCADGTRSTFVCDVRTPEEFAAGSWAGAQSAPGGQLLQYTDLFIGVRHARIVLLDAEGVRAPIVASWLRQMGHDACVHVLEGGPSSLVPGGGEPPALPAPPLPTLGAPALADALREGSVAVVDVRPSMGYRTGHVPGAIWSIRPLIAQRLRQETRPIVLVADDAAVAALAALELTPGQRREARLLEGGMAAWRQQGLTTVSTPATPADADCIDFLFFVHDRHDGNLQSARDYLSWEIGLAEKVEGYECEGYRLPPLQTARAAGAATENT